MQPKKKKYQSRSTQKTKRKKSSYIFIIIFLVLIYLFIQGDQGFFRYIKLREEKQQLLIKIEELKQENSTLYKEIDLLRNNYRYIEKIARERHQMGKKGEKVYIISPQQK